LYLPQMRVKQDAISGMEIPIWFTPTLPGQWEMACAQLCGLGHYRMRGYYTVHNQAGYDQWVAERIAEKAEDDAEPVDDAEPAATDPPAGT
jgi:cytochrome c oxidase subunit 2